MLSSLGAVFFRWDGVSPEQQFWVAEAAPWHGA